MCTRFWFWNCSTMYMQFRVSKLTFHLNNPCWPHQACWSPSPLDWWLTAHLGGQCPVLHRLRLSAKEATWAANVQLQGRSSTPTWPGFQGRAVVLLINWKCSIMSATCSRKACLTPSSAAGTMVCPFPTLGVMKHKDKHSRTNQTIWCFSCHWQLSIWLLASSSQRGHRNCINHILAQSSIILWAITHVKCVEILKHITV